MSRSPRGRRVLAAVASLAAVLGVARADAPPVAEIGWTPAEVSFQLLVPSEFRLTITGPHYAVQMEGWGGLGFVPTGRDGQPLADGVYRYELREIVTSPEIEAWEAEPDRKRRDAMRDQLVREGRWPAPPRIQHDLFRIEAGQIVAPRTRPTESREELSSEGGDHGHPH